MSPLLAPHHGAIFRCPLCPWTHEVAPVAVPPNALAGQFGPGVMTHVANVSRLEKIERALYDHLSQHTIVEWISKVRELEPIVDRLKAMPESQRIQVFGDLTAAGLFCTVCGHTLDQGVCWTCFPKKP